MAVSFLRLDRSQRDQMIHGIQLHPSIYSNQQMYELHQRNQHVHESNMHLDDLQTPALQHRGLKIFKISKFNLITPISPVILPNFQLNFSIDHRPAKPET